MQPTTYVPGVCNIGPEEVKKRLVAGWFGLILTIVVVGVLIYTGVSPWWRLVVFFPVAIGALGFLQAAFHFCVAYGSEGLFNVSNEAGKTESVSQQEFRKKDQQKVTQIITYSVLIGIAVAVATVFI
jgi:hypothetical protein